MASNDMGVYTREKPGNESTACCKRGKGEPKGLMENQRPQAQRTAGADSVSVQPFAINCSASETRPSQMLVDSQSTAALFSTGAELLSSRSNYEWIASGHQCQFGLDHPDGLTIELNSKRVANKKTEQWRRQRIRSAMEKMAAALPPQESRGGKRKKLDAVSTIHAATEYIRVLRDELAVLKRVG